MSTNTHNLNKNACQLFGGHSRQGYDWWWHSLTGRHEKTGEERAFFLEFFVCNPALQNDPVAKPYPVHLLKAKGEEAKPSYSMVKIGTWGKDGCQLHRFFPWSETKLDMGTPFSIEMANCYLNETESHGEVRITAEEAKAHPEWMCGAGTISWNLKINKQIPFNVGYGTSWLMRHLQAFEMFWHAEGMKTEYEGEIIYNGERYVITPETCFGYADKNWGKDFTTPWLWLSSCDLTSELTGEKIKDSVFDIGGGKPCVLGVSLPGKLLSAFRYKDRSFEFNFSKFWTFTRTKFSGIETEDEIVWHVEQRNWRSRMVTDIRCKKADMLLVNYEAPDGQKRHNRLWNGGTGEGTVELYHGGKLVDRLHVGHVGCEYGEYCDPAPVE